MKAKSLTQILASTLVAGALAASITGCELGGDSVAKSPELQRDPNNVEIYAAWPEAGSDGYSISRGNTKYGVVWHMNCGQRADYNVTLTPDSTYSVNVEYSNDGGSEIISVLYNNNSIGRFETQNTRTVGTNPGDGWINFENSKTFTMNTGSESDSTISLYTYSGDPYGVDINKISLEKK